MHREVCLKHRKNRRETLQRVRTQFEFAVVFVLFVVSSAGITARAAFRGHRSRAGCLSANQAMPVQFREKMHATLCKKWKEKFSAK